MFHENQACILEAKLGRLELCLCDKAAGEQATGCNARRLQARHVVHQARGTRTSVGQRHNNGAAAGDNVAQEILGG